MNAAGCQLRYYIALGAPPIRTPTDGTEPFLRPEVGFCPNWFHHHCGIDFAEPWHADPGYRQQTIRVMAAEIRRRFPGHAIGGVTATSDPTDLITGIHGAAVMGGLFGMPIRYFPNNWPSAHGPTLTDDAADRLEPPDLEDNAFFQGLLTQLDAVAKLAGNSQGYLNWQGVLNTAYRLRGEAIFIDLLQTPARAQRIFAVVTEVMIEAARRFYDRQRRHGCDVRFLTVANCMLNMISPRLYRDQLLPHDLRLRAAFAGFGVHNCAWTVDPHLDAYATIPSLGYLDMGLESDLRRVRTLFPNARRNVLYRPTDLKDKPWEQLRADLDRIAADLGPCDLGLPDIEADVPDDRIHAVLNYCAELNVRRGQPNPRPSPP